VESWSAAALLRAVEEDVLCVSSTIEDDDYWMPKRPVAEAA